jgi:hypothetical protein
MKNILLIEPSYKAKYPPLGLMKISSYHKQKGDKVFFVKGCSNELRQNIWDRIYISTLFTFHWDVTIKTIKYYSKCVRNLSDIFVGGIMATIMKREIEKEINVTVIEGLLNERGKIGYNDDEIIDTITPDYSIIDKNYNSLIDYSYKISDSYLAYSTRGCIRKCKFCAVPILEPNYMNSLSISEQVNGIKSHYGEKRHLILLDNNILASNRFNEIIEEIKSIGFKKNAKLTRIINNKKINLSRYIDFNQGLDARLLDRDKMKLISEIAIKPLRIAFDDIRYKDIYIDRVRLAAEFGIETISNYILFNFNDNPADFYERLKINVELNEEFKRNGYKSRIWSFPMKYSPIFGEYAKNRKYVGKYWNKKYLRAIQCILIPTHGIVGPKKSYFEKAFGKNYNEFEKILMLPENFIINRNVNLENMNIYNLMNKINLLDANKKKELLEIILSNEFINIETKITDDILMDILKFYRKNYE